MQEGAAVMLPTITGTPQVPDMAEQQAPWGKVQLSAVYHSRSSAAHAASML